MYSMKKWSGVMLSITQVHANALCDAFMAVPASAKIRRASSLSNILAIIL